MKPIILTLAILTAFVSAKAVEYNLTIAEEKVNITGKSVKGMTINGGIPGPTLRFTEGDTAVMHVTNSMHVPTSIHWHGLLVPPDMDGVPFISFPPIKPGATFTYRFPIRQTGTYWYHSHSGLQEQRGIFGAIVILPKEKRHGADKDHVVVLSDWTDQNPQEILRNLRRGSEFFGVRKKTAQSVLGAAKTEKLSEYFQREAMRMPAMDLADVAYDSFLVNGKPEEHLAAKPGETVRLRVIDGSASTFFHLSYAGGPMTIVGADGQPVEPVKMMEPILIGVAETYDVLVKVPADGAYEFRATAHDGSGHSSLWIGSGERKAASDLPKPFVYDTMMGFNWKNAFALTPAGTMGMPDRDVVAGKFDKPGMNMDMGGMSHGGSMKMPMAMEGMDHSAMNRSGMNHSEMKEPATDHSKMKMEMKNMPSMPEMDKNTGGKHNPPKWYDFLLREDAAHSTMLATDSMMSKERPFPPYKMLRAVKNTSFPKSAPRRDFRLTLDGDMNRYVWMINNKPLSPDDNILIREGEVIRFIMINRTMMHHPMHLHGHFFRVINGQGDRSPLKHTVDVAPMTTTVIEFMADEPGDWFFHCHLLYHMMSGMARVVEYQDFTPAPETAEIRNEIYAKSNPWFFYGYADLLSNETQGTLTFSDPLNIFALGWEAGWDGTEGTAWEGDLTYGRYFNRFTTLFAGVYAEGVNSTREDERAIVGIRYLRNFSINSNRREDFTVGIGYDNTINEAQEIALQVLTDHPAVLSDPEPLVLADSLGMATVNLRVYFWINGRQHSLVKVRSSVIRQVKRAFQQHGISMPDEAREVVFPQGIPITMLDGKPTGKSDTTAKEQLPGAMPSEELDVVSTKAEGGLQSEAGVLDEQARQAQPLREGENLLPNAPAGSPADEPPPSSPAKAGSTKTSP